MTKNEYDLIVIGAGGAGSTAAGNAAGSDKSVALIERDKVGSALDRISNLVWRS